MTASAPSPHAARAGAWLLLVAFAVELVFDLARRAVWVAPIRSEGFDDAMVAWLSWFAGAETPLAAALAALVVVACVRLRRGTSDAGARAMFIGTGVMSLLGVAALAMLHRSAAFEPGSEAAVEQMRAYFTALTVIERLAPAALLAAIWRARRAWGHGPGLAWASAALAWALRLAMLLGVIAIGPLTLHGDDAVRHELMTAAFVAFDVGARMATLVAFARVAPPEPEASRAEAAAAGLDSYFRALVARVTILIGGAVVTAAFGLGGMTPSARAAMVLGTLGLALPAVLVQIAGLTRYADAPVRIGRPALALSLLGIGVGLAIEVMMLALLAAAAWGDTSVWSSSTRTGQAQVVALGAQGLALVTVFALIVSLRRAAASLEAAALRRRADRLIVVLLGVVVAVGGLTYLLRDALGRAPLAVLGLGVVALVVGVAVFVSWLRLIEGVAAALRERVRR